MLKNSVSYFQFWEEFGTLDINRNPHCYWQCGLAWTLWKEGLQYLRVKYMQICASVAYLTNSILPCKSLDQEEISLMETKWCVILFIIRNYNIKNLGKPKCSPVGQWIHCGTIIKKNKNLWTRATNTDTQKEGGREKKRESKRKRKRTRSISIFKEVQSYIKVNTCKTQML